MREWFRLEFKRVPMATMLFWNNLVVEGKIESEQKMPNIFQIHENVQFNMNLKPALTAKRTPIGANLTKEITETVQMANRSIPLFYAIKIRPAYTENLEWLSSGSSQPDIISDWIKTESCIPPAKADWLSEWPNVLIEQDSSDNINKQLEELQRVKNDAIITARPSIAAISAEQEKTKIENNNDMIDMHIFLRRFQSNTH